MSKKTQKQIDQKDIWNVNN